MWFVLALLAAVVFGLAGFLMKLSTTRAGSDDHLLLGLYATGAVGFIVTATAQGTIGFDTATIIAAIVVGAGSVFGNVCFLRALDHGPASLTSPLANANIVFIIVMSIALYGERPSMLDLGGVALILAAVTLVAIDPHETLAVRSVRWYLFIAGAAVLLFLRNGGLKVTHEEGLDNTNVLLGAYIGGVVWFTARLLLSGVRRAPPRPGARIGLTCGLVAGVASFGGMQFYAMALAEGPASIVSPIFATNSLVVAAGSIALLGERLSRTQAIALAVAIIGLAVLRVD